jgi:hypothetical protein
VGPSWVWGCRVEQGEAYGCCAAGRFPSCLDCCLNCLLCPTLLPALPPRSPLPQALVMHTLENPPAPKPRKNAKKKKP